MRGTITAIARINMGKEQNNNVYIPKRYGYLSICID